MSLLCQPDAAVPMQRDLKDSQSIWQPNLSTLAKQASHQKQRTQTKILIFWYLFNSWFQCFLRCKQFRPIRRVSQLYSFWGAQSIYKTALILNTNFRFKGLSKPPSVATSYLYAAFFNSRTPCILQSKSLLRLGDQPSYFSQHHSGFSNLSFTSQEIFQSWANQTVGHPNKYSVFGEFRLLEPRSVYTSVSIWNQCVYILWVKTLAGKGGAGWEWVVGFRHTPQAHNITEHQICRLAGLRDLPQGHMELFSS